MMKKLSQERDPLPSCSFCEWAQVKEDEPTSILCTKYEKNVAERSCCPSYTYDLLKRRPLRMRSSSHLSEAVVENDF